MKFSVIIPIYNGEKTIGRCLDSILSQEHPDTEIILINDGSVDGTDSICVQYAAKYPEIRYYSRENRGVSSARNFGLSVSEGAYILFVDSDDWVSDQYFSRIDSCISDAPTDLTQFSWESVTADRVSRVSLTELRLQGEKAISEWALHAMQDGSFGSLWSKVFSGKIIRENSLCFPESLRIAEDWVFIFLYLLRCDSYRSMPDSLYKVSLENGDSLSRKKRDYLADQLYEANMIIYRDLERDEPKAGSFRRPLALSYYRSVYSASRELYKFDLSRKDRRKLIKEICDKYARGPVSAKGVFPRLLSIPVCLRLTFLIDTLSAR